MRRQTHKQVEVRKGGEHRPTTQKLKKQSSHSKCLLLR